FGAQPRDIRFQFIRVGRRVGRREQLLQVAVFGVRRGFTRECFLKLPFELGGGLRAVIRGLAQIRREEQRDKNQHAAHGGNDVREGEKTDFGIKASKMLSHAFSSTGIAASEACGSRAVSRSLEMMCEWQ